MYMKRLLIMAFSFLITASALIAGPTLNGYSGNGVLPDSTTTDPGSLEVAIDYYLNAGDNRQNTFPVRASLGIEEHMEVGLGYNISKI